VDPAAPRPPSDADRDYSSLEEAERELAELERELRRIDGADEPPEG
jgi:hypothetical protein